MTTVLQNTALIGFGEAGMAFAEQWVESGSAGPVHAFDIKTLDPATATPKRTDYARYNVRGYDTLAEALADADLVISVVTADQALEAAKNAAPLLKRNAIYCDFNSVAPQTKAAAADIIDGSGGRYTDVAVMSPVRPARLGVPLLVSGPHAAEACELLVAAGFRPREIGAAVGQASMIKMLRSIMVKGIEALSAECFLAAHHAGVADEVAASLNASWPGVDWREKADYNLDRIMVHGVRRAAEMNEVAATLAHLGMPNALTRATADIQRRIGELGLEPVEGFVRKAACILKAGKNAE